MKAMVRLALAVLGLLLTSSTIHAQAADSAAASLDSTLAATPAVVTDTAASVAPPVIVRPARASWLSDRLPLRVGDVLTIVVDEATRANERVSTIATGDRSFRADLNAGVGEDAMVGPAKSFGSGVRNNSRDVGEAGRTGDLTTVLSVRVTAVESNGVARITGSKKVTVDGRVQDITLSGAVRAEDVSARRLVRSSSIADAVITYNGKNITPKRGILGRIVGILWP